MEIKQIGYWDFDKYVNNDEYIIIDLRDAAEYEEGHILGAINVLFDSFGDFVKNDRLADKKMIIYCERGGRSYLIAKRYGNICDITVLGGGIHSYAGRYMIKKV